MKKLFDLSNDLNEDIDISNLSDKTLKVPLDKTPIINDLQKNLWNLNMSEKHKIKISKKTNKNPDALNNNNNNKILDLTIIKKDLSFFKNKINNFIKKQEKISEIKRKEYEKYLKQQELLENNNFNTPNPKKKKEIKLNIYNFSFNNNKNKYRALLFLILLAFLWLFSKVIIENRVVSWYENILALKNDFKDLEKARKNIKKAKLDFLISKALISPISIIPNASIQNANNLISWWYNISNLLIEWLKLYEDLNKILVNNQGIENINITEILENIRNKQENLYSILYNSLVNYSKIWDLWDENLNSKIRFVNEKLMTAIVYMEAINNNYDTLLSILWHSNSKKYLVVFQNNDEIRASGGFMWSTATITISNWKITNIENSDIYAFEWDINKVYTDKEKAPEWLNKITTTFWLRDANYFPEFKDSSAKIKYFLDKIDYKIDWIIYINQEFILDLLTTIWWVNSELLEETITSDNFSLVLSTLVEAKVFKVWSLWTPKQVLFDFAGELYNKLLKEKKYYDYANILLQHIKNRDIVFYSFNPQENNLLWRLWINGEVNFNEKLDFNYPVYTSIWWNKTDRYKEYRYDKYVYQTENSCDFITSLEIYNSHMFSKFEDEKVNELLDKHWITNKTDILNIQWRWDNKSYLRVLIPKYAQVNLKYNQKLIEEKYYNIVETYITTRKLETTKTIIEYNIPNPNCHNYSYKFFKQPWVSKYNINFDILWEKNKYNEIKTDFIYKRDEI